MSDFRVRFSEDGSAAESLSAKERNTSLHQIPESNQETPWQSAATFSQARAARSSVPAFPSRELSESNWLKAAILDAR